MTSSKVVERTVCDYTVVQYTATFRRGSTSSPDISSHIINQSDQQLDNRNVTVKAIAPAMRLPPTRLPNGSTLPISQAEGVLGGVIWAAATSLCRHLLLYETPLLRATSADGAINATPALELGSGTGFVGIYFAAASNRRVILTERRSPLAAALSSVSYNVDGTLDYDFLEGKDIPKSDVMMNLLQENVQQNIHPL
jgi:Lysine methyltransferase